MEPEVSQEPSTGSYPEPDQSINNYISFISLYLILQLRPAACHWLICKPFVTTGSSRSVRLMECCFRHNK
jgi:hypothetical protein